jgi:ATPase subunit of ABC transporter with duplicated ATPase domains
LLSEEQSQTNGQLKWGATVLKSYFPKNHDHFFNTDYSIVTWHDQYMEEKEESLVRGFLGRMLFSGDEPLKKCKVLSGGEKVRCMLSKIMCEAPNTILLDQPTNHLDLESITSLNNGLIEFKGNLIFYSHDHQFIHTVANRIIEIAPKGIIDKRMSYDDYISDEKVKLQREELQ